MKPQRQTTIIHVVRHGAVENPGGIRYGRLPGIHLSETGRRQAEDVSLFFAGRKITHIYTSPMERTQQTATIIGLAFPSAPITLDDRIIETKTASSFEGKARKSGFFFPPNATPDAENAEAIIARFQAFMEEKIIRHNGQEIIAVSHADPIALLYSFLVYQSVTTERDPYPGYASVFSFVFLGLALKQTWYWESDVTAAATPKPI